MQEVIFHYLISEPADLAKDKKLYEPLHLHAEVKFSSKKEMSQEEYSKMHNQLKEALSSDLDIEPKLIRCMTREEAIESGYLEDEDLEVK